MSPDTVNCNKHDSISEILYHYLTSNYNKTLLRLWEKNSGSGIQIIVPQFLGEGHPHNVFIN